MSPRGRTVLFIVSAVAAFALMLYGAAGLPQFGAFSGVYADTVLRVATMERAVYNVPTAINFDYRGFDTLGEEFIFFTSVTGLLFILSAARGPVQTHKEPLESHPVRRRTGAIRWFASGLTGFIAAMGMDLGAHGQLTPGGGFQGGAVFGSALACVYLGFGMNAFIKIAKKELFDFLDALGAFSYSALGVATAFTAGWFLKNALPLGQTGALVSGGTIYLISCIVFVEIGAGFTVLLLTFLKQTVQTEGDEA
jgi:multicomponent Na+:H+ antiporter subunit B